jgi:hypothetical protein
MIGRRGLLKGGIAAALLQGCGDYYACDGARMSNITDGQLIPTTAAYFNQGGTATRTPVKEYDPEISDLVNETYMKMHGCGIDHHLCIEYADELQGDLTAEYNTSQRWDWHRMRRKKEKQVVAERSQEPFRHFFNLGHELGHQFSQNEGIATLHGYLMSAFSDISFPQFAKDTNYMNFGIAHGEMMEMLDWNLILNNLWDEHNYGTLAALLAINQTNGQLGEAQRWINEDPEYFAAKARDFADHYYLRTNLVSGKAVDPVGGESDLTTFERVFAAYNLWNIVAHQVIVCNVEANTSLDTTTKAELLAGMKSAARFKLTSTLGDGTVIFPSMQLPQPNYYTAGIVPNEKIIVPAGYDNDIPRGI